MPVDGPSYLVGRTDKRVLTKFCSGTKNQCLWTGPYPYSCDRDNTVYLEEPVRVASPTRNNVNLEEPIRVWPAQPG